MAQASLNVNLPPPPHRQVFDCFSEFRNESDTQGT